MNKIGIIGAMELEVEELKSKLQNAKVTKKTGMDFYEGILNGANVVIVRCGIGKDYAQGYQVNYVLSRFSSEELKLVEPCIERAVSAVKSFVTVGMQMTMNQFNTKEAERAKELAESSEQ